MPAPQKKKKKKIFFYYHCIYNVHNSCRVSHLALACLYCTQIAVAEQGVYGIEIPPAWESKLTWILMDGKNSSSSKQVGKVSKLSNFLKSSLPQITKIPCYSLHIAQPLSKILLQYYISYCSTPTKFFTYLYFLLCYSADKTHLLTAKCIWSSFQNPIFLI